MVGGLGFGDAAARELGKRVAQLEELQRLLLILQGEIRCVRLTLPAVCELLAKDAKAPFQQFFWKVSEDLGKRTGQTAGEIWSRNLKEIQKLLFLTKKEQQDLEDLTLFSPDKTEWRSTAWAYPSVPAVVQILPDPAVPFLEGI